MQNNGACAGALLEGETVNVVIFETEEWERRACLPLGAVHTLDCTAETLDHDSVGRYAMAEVVSVFVNSRLTAELLDQLPQLRLIATRSTGYDHIDLEYCRRRGIAVCNVPDYGDATVAEHAFALLLATVRHITDASERTRRGDFSQYGLRGFELRGKTMGVIGAGRIGRHVIGIARGFGMKVMAFDALPDPLVAARLGFAFAPFDEVLAAADVLTIHVPATAQTSHLISDREFGLMKHGSVLVNTARGSVVDMSALVRALAEGRLRGVGLDVLPQERLVKDEAEIFRTAPDADYDFKALVANHVVLQFPNVVVTPHSAYNTDEAVHRIIETTVDNIERFAKGEARNMVQIAR